MSDFGAKYIEKLRKEVEDARIESIKRGISELELYEEVKTYAPDDVTDKKTAQDKGFYETEIVDGVERYYYTTTRPAEISDDEYKTICELRDEKRRYKRGADQTKGNSAAATFLKIVSWILWIGGFIVAAVSATTDVYNVYGYSDTEFSFGIFFITLFTYAMYGALTMCAAELFSNVSRILSALLSIVNKSKTAG